VKHMPLILFGGLGGILDVNDNLVAREGGVD
jgi:hypothetical protein